jgi:hypothetical protein
MQGPGLHPALCIARTDARRLSPAWGFSLLRPEEAQELHTRVPLSYYDCALLAKRLGPPRPPAQPALPAGRK